MRVLVTVPSAWGHLHPMVPLARALHAGGHEVVLATGADSCGWVEGAGLRAFAAGVEQSALLAALADLPEDARRLPPAQIPDVMFGRIFGQIAAPRTLADLNGLLDSWVPDLVVNDAAELAGPLVAARLGVPNATKGFGPLLPARRVAGAADAVAHLWTAAGLEPRPFAGCYDHLYIDIYPPALHQASADHVGRRQHLRPVTYDDGVAAGVAAAPEDWSGLSPDIYVTMGTVFSQSARLRGLVAALAGLGLDVLATVGPGGDPAALGDLPSRVRVERYVPQSLILGRCRVVVSHGGSGTVLQTLSRGVPQLCLPQGADQFLNADAVVAAEAGLALGPAEADPSRIVEAVGRLLDDPRYAHGARAAAAAIAEMPGLSEVVATLESLAA